MEPLPIPISRSSGLLIGTSAALFLLITGRIAGISRLVAAAARIAHGGPLWSHAATFVAGLPLGAWLIKIFIRAPAMGAWQLWIFVVAMLAGRVIDRIATISRSKS